VKAIPAQTILISYVAVVASNMSLITQERAKINEIHLDTPQIRNIMDHLIRNKNLQVDLVHSLCLYLLSQSHGWLYQLVLDKLAIRMNFQWAQEALMHLVEPAAMHLVGLVMRPLDTEEVVDILAMGDMVQTMLAEVDFGLGWQQVGFYLG